jgi:hypothetical protein
VCPVASSAGVSRSGPGRPHHNPHNPPRRIRLLRRPVLGLAVQRPPYCVSAAESCCRRRRARSKLTRTRRYSRTGEGTAAIWCYQGNTAGFPWVRARWYKRRAYGLRLAGIAPARQLAAERAQELLESRGHLPAGRLHLPRRAVGRARHDNAWLIAARPGSWAPMVLMHKGCPFGALDAHRTRARAGRRSSLRHLGAIDPKRRPSSPTDRRKPYISRGSRCLVMAHCSLGASSAGLGIRHRPASARATSNFDRVQSAGEGESSAWHCRRDATGARAPRQRREVSDAMGQHARGKRPLTCGAIATSRVRPPQGIPRGVRDAMDSAAIGLLTFVQFPWPCSRDFSWSRWRAFTCRLCTVLSAAILPIGVCSFRTLPQGSNSRERDAYFIRFGRESHPGASSFGVALR